MNENMKLGNKVLYILGYIVDMAMILIALVLPVVSALAINYAGNVYQSSKQTFDGAQGKQIEAYYDKEDMRTLDTGTVEHSVKYKFVVDTKQYSFSSLTLSKSEESVAKKSIIVCYNTDNPKEVVIADSNENYTVGSNLKMLAKVILVAEVLVLIILFILKIAFTISSYIQSKKIKEANTEINEAEVNEIEVQSDEKSDKIKQ